MTWDQWAERIYPVLIGAATRGETLRYGELKEQIGWEGQADWLGTPLGRIATYCRRHEFPSLNVIVIGQSGAPGPGIPFVDDHLAERELVFEFPWYRQRPVRPTDFLEEGCRALAGAEQPISSLA